MSILGWHVWIKNKSKDSDGGSDGSSDSSMGI